MSPELLIILMSTFLPAGAVSMVLYKGGKTRGYAIFGGLVTYAISLGLLLILFKLWSLWPNMPFQAFVLIMPLAVAGFFVWQLKDRGPNR
jgi:hypothetical protein